MKIATLMLIHDILTQEIERREAEYNYAHQAYACANEDDENLFVLRRKSIERRDYLNVATAAMQDFESHNFS